MEVSEWSASCPSRFTPRERAPGTHWIGGWVGSRAVLDAVVKRKIPSLRLESNPRTPIVQSVAQRYTDWAIFFSLWNILFSKYLSDNWTLYAEANQTAHFVDLVSWISPHIPCDCSSIRQCDVDLVSLVHAKFLSPCVDFRDRFHGAQNMWNICDLWVGCAWSSIA
jgi:hypothetical protein